MLRLLGRRAAIATATAAATAATAYAEVSPPARKETSISTESERPISQASLVTATAPLTESIRLPDGRSLSFRAVGDPHGVPVFALHGMGSSHRTWKTEQPLSEVVSGVLLIAVDRPGYGDSSPPPAAYSYTQSANDLACLADHLGVRRFCVAGHSSGGPYALAAAAVLPERVLACAAVSSDPPYMHPATPESVRKSDDMVSLFYGADPLVKVGKWRAKDLADPRKTDKRHAWKQGTVGWAMDFTLERIPWSFKLESIGLGTRLSFWHGTEDYPAIKEGAPFMRSLVPGAPKLIAVQGHHGFKSEPQHLASILTELREAARSAPAEGASHEAVKTLLGELGLGKKDAAATPREKPWWKIW